MKRPDVDTALVFFLLAVTVAQMGAYLASYAVGWMKALGYLQAIAIDAAIWRSAWWYRRDRSAKRRRVSLFGVVAFSLVSAWYNFGYYTLRAPSLPVWHRALMAAVLPAGVALLSYLAAQHETQPAKPREQAAHHDAATATDIVYIEPTNAQVCTVCGWSCNEADYSSHRGAVNALAAHSRTHKRSE